MKQSKSTNHLKDKVRQNVNKRFKMFSTKIVPQLVEKKSDQNFIQKMVSVLPYVQSTKLTNIAKALLPDDMSIQLHSMICYLSNHLKTIQTPLLQKLLLKDTVNKLKDKEFYLIIDTSSIEKKYADEFNKHGKSMQYLCHLWDNAQKKIVKGYYLLTVIAVIKKTHESLILGSTIFSSNSPDFLSETNELKKLLNPIIAELEHQNKLPYTVICDSGYDDLKIFQYFEKQNLNFLIKYKNTRKFIPMDKQSTNHKKTSYTIEQLFKENKEKHQIIYYTKQGKKRKTIGTYQKCWIHNDSTPIYVIIYYDMDKQSYAALLTTNSIRNKFDLQNCIYRYCNRWPIEEMFRYMKSIFHIEDFFVRSLQSINNLLLLIMLAINQLTKILIRKMKLKYAIFLLAKTNTKPNFQLYKIASGLKESITILPNESLC